MLQCIYSTLKIPLHEWLAELSAQAVQQGLNLKSCLGWDLGCAQLTGNILVGNILVSRDYTIERASLKVFKLRSLSTYVKSV